MDGEEGIVCQGDPHLRVRVVKWGKEPCLRGKHVLRQEEGSSAVIRKGAEFGAAQGAVEVYRIRSCELSPTQKEINSEQLPLQLVTRVRVVR
jgi:hypothetical protein